MSIQLNSNEIELIEKAFDLLNDHITDRQRYDDKAIESDEKLFSDDDFISKLRDEQISELEAVTDLRDKLIAENAKAVDMSMSEE